MHFESNDKPVIKFSDNVSSFFDELITTLFEQGYFGYIDSAFQYVSDLKNYIETYIHILPAYSAPHYFNRYQKDMRYIAYQANRKTTWYIFFKQNNNRFLIYHITNNHFEGQYIR